MNSVSWADMSDEETDCTETGCTETRCTEPKINKWSKPLIIDKNLLEKIKENIYIQCRDCKKNFVWDIKDQYFYEQKGYSPPKTCKSCKISRNMIGPPPRVGRKKKIDLS